MARKALAGLTIQVEVLQARGLIGKDRNLVGKRSTSDPYVRVYCGDTPLGRTKTVKKTLSPIWNETFEHTVGADRAYTMLRSDKAFDIKFHLFDQDNVSSDDPMGCVLVPLNPLWSETTAWYPVQEGSGECYCRNAKGEVQIKVSLNAHQLVDVTRGHVHRLRHNRITVGLAWDVEDGQIVDLDSSVVAVDQQGNVHMDETVYYGNLTNSNMSLVHSGDEVTGAKAGDDESIQVELDIIPKNIMALYFLLTVSTPGKTLADVKSAQVRFVETETKMGICRFVPCEMGKNTSLFLVRIARDQSPAMGDKWNLTPIADGNEYGRDFGSLIPEIKGYTRDLVPDIIVKPEERIAVMRKDGTIRVSDYVPGYNLPQWATFGLSWDVTNGVEIDLDASAVLFDEQVRLVDTVSFRQLVSLDGSIRHSGDEREGDEVGDDEKINISLSHVSSNVKYIGIVVNSFSGQELDDISKAACHLYDPSTRTDIAKYTLTNAKDLDKHTALILGCLYRVGGKEWHLRTISKPTNGRTALDIVDELQSFLIRFAPQPPSTVPEQQAVVLTEMPTVEACAEEVVILPPEHVILIPPEDIAIVVHEDNWDDYMGTELQKNVVSNVVA